MNRACLLIILGTICLSSVAGQTCSDDTCKTYAAAQVGDMDATSGADVQLLQRQASQGDDVEEGDNDDPKDDVDDVDGAEVLDSEPEDDADEADIEDGVDVDEAEVLDSEPEDEDADEADIEDGDDSDKDVDEDLQNDAALFSLNGDGKDSCDALYAKYPKLVKVDFSLAQNTVNNLGGAGPGNGPEMLYYKNAATGDDGRSTYDLKVTVIGNSYDAPAPKFNGQSGHYGVINVACGSSVDVKFELLDQSGKPATLKNLIFSWFDLDKGEFGGGLESVTLWPGYAEYVVSSSSEVYPDEINCPAGAGNGKCKIFKASTWGVGKDNPKNPLALTKQQAARTFATYYSDASSFRVTLTAGEGHGSRNFLFTGMSQVAYGALEECCPAHICGCQSECDNPHMVWEKKCELGKCADCEQCTTTTTTTTEAPVSKEEACKSGLSFDLSEDKLVENTLGKEHNGRMLFKKVLEYNGRSVDLSITDHRKNHKKYGYKKFRADGRAYTGTYKEAGRIAFDRPGRYVFQFAMLDSQTGKPVTLPLIPFSLYDVDGKNEAVEACDVARIITHPNTRLKESGKEACYSHRSKRLKNEVNLPPNFDALTVNQKKQAVTYVYSNKDSWTLGVAIGKGQQNRYVLFKSSKVLACDYKDKVRDEPWKNKGKNGDA